MMDVTKVLSVLCIVVFTCVSLVIQHSIAVSGLVSGNNTSKAGLVHSSTLAVLIRKTRGINRIKGEERFKRKREKGRKKMLPRRKLRKGKRKDRNSLELTCVDNLGEKSFHTNQPLDIWQEKKVPSWASGPLNSTYLRIEEHGYYYLALQVGYQFREAKCRRKDTRYNMYEIQVKREGHTSHSQVYCTGPNLSWQDTQHKYKGCHLNFYTELHKGDQLSVVNKFGLCFSKIATASNANFVLIEKLL